MTHDEMLALPKARHEAMSVGSNKYFTGEACSKGHISGRSTNTSRCVKCSSIYEISKYREKVKTGAKYKPENIEKVKARNAKYRLNNLEKVKAKNANYFLENQEKVKARRAKYKLENPEKVKAREAKYFLKNHEKLKARRAKYFLENQEKVKARRAKYKLENPEKVLQKIRDNVDLIKPRYIAGLLKVSTKQLTPEIIELKRLQIQLHRAIKESQS